VEDVGIAEKCKLALELRHPYLGFMFCSLRPVGDGLSDLVAVQV
jgi:hypothetical protein